VGNQKSRKQEEQENADVLNVRETGRPIADEEDIRVSHADHLSGNGAHQIERYGCVVL
jgi:hypothetical protein